MSVPLSNRDLALSVIGVQCLLILVLSYRLWRWERVVARLLRIIERMPITPNPKGG